MRTTTVIAQMLVRLCGVILIVLGILFWTGNALSLVNLHMLIGLLFVLSLWVVSVLAGVAHQSGGLVALGIIWGIIVLALGMTQSTLMPGAAHWMIQVLHLLVGLIAIGIGERIAMRTKVALAPTA